MRFPALIAATLALSLSAGCTPSAPPADPPPPIAPAGDLYGPELWRARGLDSYAYQLEISCFCIHRGRYAVEVRDGEIASVRDAATGAPAEESRAVLIPTVDRLFQAIDDAMEAATPVRATYHPLFGYPTEAEIGLLANDSGTLYRITNLRPL